MAGSSHHEDATLPPEACQGLQAILLNFLEVLQSERGHSPSDLTHGHSGCLGLLDSSVEEGTVRRTRLPGRVLELSQTCWRQVCRWPEAAVPGSPSCALGKPEDVRNASGIPSNRTSESLQVKQKKERMLQ